MLCLEGPAQPWFTDQLHRVPLVIIKVFPTAIVVYLDQSGCRENQNQWVNVTYKARENIALAAVPKALTSLIYVCVGHVPHG